MPLTAEQSYALGTKEGRDRINQQLRANPQYVAFLRSIGVDPNAPRLSDQQRKMAADWVRRNVSDIGGLEIDPSGNLNNPQGFGQKFEQWGLPVAAGATMAFGVPGLFPGLLNGAIGGPAAAAGPGGLYEAAPASIASQGVSAPAAGGLGTMAPTTATALAGGGSAIDRIKSMLTSPQGIGTAASIAATLARAGGDGTSAESRNLEQQAARNAAITEARMRRVDPLHEAAVQLAFGRLPVSSRDGISLTRVPLPG